MAKNRKKLIHIHSSVYDKQPTQESLEYGELAVNNNDGMSFISTKNKSDEVVRFSEDKTLVDWMEYKTVFPYKAIVDNVDLDKNKSNIEFKMNQAVASNTPHHGDVDHAKDIDGQDIGENGGFAIDMSQYAMVGAKPSFKTVSTTEGADIKGDSVVISGKTATIYRTPSDVSGDTVDKALDEVLNRSKVTSVEDEKGSLMRFFQDGKEISSISLSSLSPTKGGGGKNSTVTVGDTQKAEGDYSFAEGQNTIAKNRSEHAMGEFNASHQEDKDSFGSSGNTLFSIGNGTSEGDRKNAVEVMQNGDIYIYIKDANGEAHRMCLNDMLTSLLWQTY